MKIDEFSDSDKFNIIAASLHYISASAISVALSFFLSFLLSFFPSICGNIEFDERRTKSKWVDGRRERFCHGARDFLFSGG